MYVNLQYMQCHVEAYKAAGQRACENYMALHVLVIDIHKGHARRLDLER